MLWACLASAERAESSWAEMAVLDCPGQHWADLRDLVVLRTKGLSVYQSY